MTKMNYSVGTQTNQDCPDELRIGLESLGDLICKITALCGELTAASLKEVYYLRAQVAVPDLRAISLVYYHF